MKSLFGQWLAEMRRTLRDRRFFLFTLVMPIALYLIYVNQGNGAGLRIEGNAWNAYFMVSMAAFGVVGSSVNTLAVRLSAERQNGWIRLIRTTPLKTGQYAAAKILTQLTLSAAVILAVFLAARLDQRVSLPPAVWIEAGLWLWIASAPFAALGVLIGNTGSAAQVLGSLTYLVLSLLGGLWTPVSKFPPVMQTIARWMPTYHFARPAWNILGGKGISLSDIAVLIGYTALFTILSAALQRRLDTRPAG